MEPNTLFPCFAAQDEKTFFLKVHVQPRASRTRLVGLHGEALKISITAPPVDGKANQEIISFFAKLFHIPKKSISIKSGRQSRTKLLRIEQFSLAAAQQILADILSG
jgi:uncharacterized protein (TIGR00251 family)